MVQVRSDLAQGAENKLPVGKIHMWDAKIGFTQDQIVIKEDVQIQRPGAQRKVRSRPAPVRCGGACPEARGE